MISLVPKLQFGHQALQARQPSPGAGWESTPEGILPISSVSDCSLFAAPRPSPARQIVAGNSEAGTSPAAVPKIVEQLRRLAGYRPEAEHVQIVEVVAAAQTVVIVTDVPAAQDRRMVVRHDELVVHARVHLLKAPKEVDDHAGLALLLGVEQAQLDVGMPVNGDQGLVAANEEKIIDQAA